MVGNGSTMDSRYCSDPLKMLGRDVSDGSMSLDSVKSHDSMKLQVDDEDYLMPRPQSNRNASTYLDLLSDAKKGKNA